MSKKLRATGNDPLRDLYRIAVCRGLIQDDSIGCPGNEVMAARIAALIDKEIVHLTFSNGELTVTFV